MFMKRKPGQKICDVNYFTARRLEDMAESLGRLARSFDSQELGGADADGSRGTGGDGNLGSYGLRGLLQVQSPF